MSSDQLIIKNARLSYPNIYEVEKYKKKPTKNYAATLLFSQEREDLYAKIVALGGGEYQEVMGSSAEDDGAWDAQKCSLKNGDANKSEDYHGMWALKTTSQDKILTIDRQKKILTAGEGRDARNGVFYAGCYVDATVDFWVSKEWGDIRCNVYILQFRADGDKLGGGGPSAASLIAGMEAIPESDDDIDL